MRRFMVRKVISAVVLLVVIPVFTFLLMNINSSNVARQILGQTATHEQVALKTAELGLDRPVFTRLFEWFSGAFQGDLGRSWFTSEQVTNALSTRLPVTLSIVVLTTVVAAVLALIAGVASAIYRGWVDALVQSLVIIGFALPGFWVALMLAIQFGINLGWFPATGYVPFGASPGEWLRSITLPIVALSLGAIASAAQQIRGALIDVLEQDWIRTLRSRGIPQHRVIFKHALRSAAVPGVTVLGLQFVGLMGVVVFVEQIFALPGIGRMIVSSAQQGDVPFVLGVVLAMTVVVVIVNFIIDISVATLNPKARLS